MTLQSEFADAGHEYARRLTEQREADRLAALAREGRHEDNAAAFAAAITEALNGIDTEHEETNQ